MPNTTRQSLEIEWHKWPEERPATEDAEYWVILGAVGDADDEPMVSICGWDCGEWLWADWGDREVKEQERLLPVLYWAEIPEIDTKDLFNST